MKHSTEIERLAQLLGPMAEAEAARRDAVRHERRRHLVAELATARSESDADARRLQAARTTEAARVADAERALAAAREGLWAAQRAVDLHSHATAHRVGQLESELRTTADPVIDEAEEQLSAAHDATRRIVPTTHRWGKRLVWVEGINRNMTEEIVTSNRAEIEARLVALRVAIDQVRALRYAAIPHAELMDRLAAIRAAVPAIVGAVPGIDPATGRAIDATPQEPEPDVFTRRPPDPREQHMSDVILDRAGGN